MRKKIIAMILVLVVTVTSVLVFSVNGSDNRPLSITSGHKALCSQFVDGKSPNLAGVVIDYKYYSPVGRIPVEKAIELTTDENGEEVTQPDTEEKIKYPVVFNFQGEGNNSKKGVQLTNKKFANWSSYEYQMRFKNTNGAFLVALRAPSDEWSSQYVRSVKNTMDDFIQRNIDDIDPSRIYLVGHCYGGRMVRDMLAAYPYYFAAAILSAPYSAPDKNDIKKFADVPTWIFCHKADNLVPWGWIQTHIDTVKKYSSHPDDSRYTKFDEMKDENGKALSMTHESDYPIYWDMLNPNDNAAWKKSHTQTVADDKISIQYPDGCISWLSSFTSQYDGSDKPFVCKCTCHTSKKGKLFFWKIKMFFSRIFNIKKNKTCACGASHW